MNAAAVERILASVTMKVQLGGGVRDMKTVDGWLEKGVARVIIGTAAVEDPAFVREAARRIPAASRSASTRATAASRSTAGRDTSDISALDLGRRFEDAGVAAIIYTDISRDGVLQGLNIAATVALAEARRHPRHRLGRARLDRGRQAPARTRLRAARRRDHRARALRRAARSARGAGADPQAESRHA